MKAQAIAVLVFFMVIPVADAQELQHSFFLDLRYEGGALSLNDVFVASGSVPAQQEGEYQLEVRSFDNEALHSYGFALPDTVIDHDRGVVSLERFDFPLQAPYFGDAKEIVITKNGEEALAVDVSEFSVGQRKSGKEYPLVIMVAVAAVGVTIFFLVLRSRSRKDRFDELRRKWGG